MQRVDATVCRLDYDDIVRAVEKIGKVEKLIQQEKKVLLRLHQDLHVDSAHGQSSAIPCASARGFDGFKKRLQAVQDEMKFVDNKWTYQHFNANFSYVMYGAGHEGEREAAQQTAAKAEQEGGSVRELFTELVDHVKQNGVHFHRYT